MFSEIIKDSGIRLPSNIADGKVEKYVILANHIYEISLLVLSPNSKVKPHRHTGEAEIYFFVEDKRIEICDKGAEHSASNDSNSEKHIISIKSKEEENLWPILQNLWN